jgi:hypothetical protein
MFLWHQSPEEYVPTNNKNQIDMISNLNMILDSLSSDVCYKGNQLHKYCTEDQFSKLVAKRKNELVNMLFVAISLAMNANSKFIKKWNEVHHVKL